MTPHARRRPGGRPWVRSAVTVLVAVVIFAGVLPRIGHYSTAWELLRRLSLPDALLLATMAVVNLLSYAPVWMAALPGIGLVRATMTDQVSTALSNTVPAGFAVGVGINASMFHAYGYSAEQITRAIGLSGIWNNLVKFAMPAVALVALTLTGREPAGLVAVAVLGAGLLLVAIAVLVAVLGHPRAAQFVGGTAERVAGAALRPLHRPAPTGWAAGTDRFRCQVRRFVRRRWAALTAAAVASHVALFLLFLTTLRAVDGRGADAPWLEVLAVFAVTRLITLVPITPGALGVAELSYVAGLTAIGVDGSAATATVLLFRFLTWFLPVPVGALCWVLIRRGRAAASRALGAHDPREGDQGDDQADHGGHDTDDQQDPDDGRPARGQCEGEHLQHPRGGRQADGRRDERPGGGEPTRVAHQVGEADDDPRDQRGVDPPEDVGHVAGQEGDDVPARPDVQEPEEDGVRHATGHVAGPRADRRPSGGRLLDHGCRR